MGWTEDVVGSTTEDEILFTMSEGNNTIKFHDDGNGFTRTKENRRKT